MRTTRVAAALLACWGFSVLASHPSARATIVFVIETAEEAAAAFPFDFEATGCVADGATSTTSANINCDSTTLVASGSEAMRLDADTPGVDQIAIFDGVIDPPCLAGTLTFSIALVTATTGTNYGDPTIMFRASGVDVLPRIDVRGNLAGRIVCPDSTNNARSSSIIQGSYGSEWAFTFDQDAGSAEFTNSNDTGAACDGATSGTAVDGFYVRGQPGQSIDADNFDFTCTNPA